MESQDGISVRPMRLKVLYTFDDESKTNCLARWPHLLDIQTASLDEKTQIGVIELKTCIQAIVSASPELVAKLGQDYTVYAYDYSEYETPLVGQGMLSWVLASASPTPDAPAHQSKTMVTGRVCKNVLGLFSKGAQETLEVKLRLVPVPTCMQSEYLDSMQKYRELSNIIPHDFDAQSWTNFLRQNSGLFGTSHIQPSDRTSSPMDHSGIERFHQLLSEGSMPREMGPSMPSNGTFRSISPAQSALAPPSRASTPGQLQHQHQQLQLHQAPQMQQQQQEMSHGDSIRPSSSASMRDSELPVHVHYGSRRGSMQSGYGSGDESGEQQPRKRAKLYRADWPGRTDFNIERQPSSLRVAASTAASVRIHRPTPINPAIAAAQNSNDAPVRPPTPISHANDFPRRARPTPTLLRESSVQSTNNYTSPYPISDDHPGDNTQSPEESRYQGLFEPSISMPSSPPVLDCGFPNASSPALPPMVTDPDSGFMSGGLEDLLSEDMGTPLEDCAKSMPHEASRHRRTVDRAVNASSPINLPTAFENQAENMLNGDELPTQPLKGVAAVPVLAPAPAPPRGPASVAGSRPSSRASFRQAPKPLAPAPFSQSELEQLMNAIPASDPVMPSQAPAHYAHSWTGPMSDLPSAETPTPKAVTEDGKVRSGAGARRLRQVQARLDKCIRDGQVPPYCENCGSIETPTWRRAWSKEFDGGEKDANELMKDPTMLFWQVLERNDQDQPTKFKMYKKSLVDADNDFVQILLCNPCGLWLHKFKCMRPENKWNKSANGKKKRPPRNRKTGGPLSDNNTATKNPGRPQASKAAGSSPGASDASSPAEDETPRADNGNETQNDQENNDEVQEMPSQRRRANSVEPRRSSDTAQNRWQAQDPTEALRRAIQSSPARNLEKRGAVAMGDHSLTPKRLRRALFHSSQNEGGALKALGDSILNSPRRSPRVGCRDPDKQAEDKENAAIDKDLRGLFESPSFDFDLPTSPTPRRRNQRSNLLGEKRNSLPFISPLSKTRKDASSDMTPTKVTAQRLQRIQGNTTSSPRQNKTPKSTRSLGSDLSPTPNDSFAAEDLTNINSMIVDIFADVTASAHDDPFFFEQSKGVSNSTWSDWIPSDFVSPAGSEEGQTNEAQQRDRCSGASQDEDLINAILSDPDIQKNAHFDPFHFADASVLDSGFFGSDSASKKSAQKQ
ncbi:putative GATA transcription factor (Ams2) [Aspergillus clavatus NRRL 1]|uniref:GATA transcription factor (Ams2), putative n=1 Tax=Aspergillus clavatus (strain ATCC 1007 / CBS 513.65 / DSM 816 / NCTC 3887 / NRRL 1 / QM 1276 / 107) TaxID=344612 RepID=A1CBL5_ASPCL|nr:GATA transcription factor (Ams2), putative [Aspergillus clavatus NRRL 1]EAW13133.1 GATA transcription factor (Ams2), putative [Aspergillus clavatus NRRL 1]